MMERFNKIFLLLVAILANTSVYAYDFGADGLYYTIISLDDTTCEVASVDNNYSGKIVIPSTVRYSNMDFTVTRIGDAAFKYSNVTSVTIPNSVTAIGTYAFSYCTSLTSVTIPNSVTGIGYEAFCCCSSLTSVTIPNSVSDMGACAFALCSSLTSVTISDSLTYIAQSAFSGCSSLTSVIIGKSVSVIYDSAFSLCTSLTSVKIPDSVNEIGQSAFHGCSNLAYVTFGNSVTNIGSWAFTGCSSLTSVTIPNSVTAIGTYAFSGCTSLTSMTIGNSVTIIDASAFKGCSNLTEIKSLSLMPPSCNDGYYSPFDNNTYANATLYVPSGTFAAYRDAPGWSEFQNIKEGFEMSGVAEHTTDVNISVTTNFGFIEVAGVKNGAIIDVYNTNGQLVYKGTETTINVPTKGIYIVRVAGQSFKVII